LHGRHPHRGGVHQCGGRVVAAAQERKHAGGAAEDDSGQDTRDPRAQTGGDSVGGRGGGRRALPAHGRQDPGGLLRVLGVGPQGRQLVADGRVGAAGARGGQQHAQRAGGDQPGVQRHAGGQRRGVRGGGAHRRQHGAGADRRADGGRGEGAEPAQPRDRDLRADHRVGGDLHGGGVLHSGHGDVQGLSVRNQLCDRHVCGVGARGPAGDGDDVADDRGQAHGGRERAGQGPAGRRDAGRHHAAGHRQDRHADAQPDDGRQHLGERRHVRRHARPQRRRRANQRRGGAGRARGAVRVGAVPQRQVRPHRRGNGQAPAAGRRHRVGAGAVRRRAARRRVRRAAGAPRQGVRDPVQLSQQVDAVDPPPAARRRRADAAHQGRARARAAAVLGHPPRRRRRAVDSRAARAVRRHVLVHGGAGPPRAGICAAGARRRGVPGRVRVRPQARQLPGGRVHVCGAGVAGGPAQARRARGDRAVPRGRHPGDDGDRRPPADGRGDRPQDQPGAGRDARGRRAAHRPRRRRHRRGRVRRRRHPRRAHRRHDRRRLGRRLPQARGHLCAHVAQEQAGDRRARAGAGPHLRRHGRRRQRLAGAEEGRPGHRHERVRVRRVQGGSVDDPARRQLRVDRQGHRGGPPDLRQPQKVHPLHAHALDTRGRPPDPLHHRAAAAHDHVHHDP
ncbi:hypothetical protein IWW47_003840, partial [Coemansia sp. RSA 2052]